MSYSNLIGEYGLPWIQLPARHGGMRELEMRVLRRKELGNEIPPQLAQDLEFAANRMFLERGLELDRPASKRPVWHDFDYGIVVHPPSNDRRYVGVFLARHMQTGSGVDVIVYELTGTDSDSRGLGILRMMFEAASPLDVELTHKISPREEYPFLRALRTSYSKAHEMYLRRSDKNRIVPATHDNGDGLYKPPNYFVHFYGVNGNFGILDSVAHEIAGLPPKFRRIQPKK